MKPYGEKPKTGEYNDWFDTIDPRQPELSEEQAKSSIHSVHPTESSREDTLRPNIKIEFGVNEIRVTGGGKKSRCFNDGTNGKLDPGVGETGEDCFNFSPTHDSSQMKIEIQVHHPHFIQSAKLEMFCRNHKEPIWSRCWGNLWSPTIKDDTNRKIEEIIPRGKNDGTADFEIDWSEIQLPKDLIIPGDSGKPDFIDGVAVVPRSPYRLKFSVSARAASEDSPDKDKFRFPQTAWTYIHVLVKELSLKWGTDEMIPKDRPDVVYASKLYQSKVRAAELDNLLQRQKNLLSKLADGKAALSAGQSDSKSEVLELNFNVPDFDKHDSSTEYSYFRDMWGNGPLIPLVLQAKIKKIDGEGVIDAKGLGMAQFIWEWQDNEKENLGDHLDKWLSESSAITKYFVKKVFKDNRDEAKFPFHGFNCSDKYGGKRGMKRPAPEGKDSFVFPESPAIFPNQVKHELKKRDWTAVSYADPSDTLKDRDGNNASTAVLFQPSIIAGDRFRVSVCLVTENISEFDKDLEGDAYYDLIKDADEKTVPWAKTNYFEVWRHINTTFYYTPSFTPNYAEIVQYIEDQLTREVGFKMKIETKPFPDLRKYFSENVESMIRKNSVFNSNNIPIFLRAFKELKNGDKDYAFDTLDDLDKVVDLYKTKKWCVVEGLAAATGLEITGVTSKAKALVQVDASNKTKMVLMLEGELVEGEDFDCGEGANGSKVKGKIGKIEKPVVTCWGREVKIVSDKNMSSRDVKVSTPNIDTVTLKYTEGSLTATRQLSTTRINQLKEFCNKLKDHPNDQPLEIKITGKDDTRGVVRLDEVKKWLQEHILDAKQIMYKNFDQAFNDCKPKDITGTSDTWSEQTMRRAFMALQRNINWRKIFNESFKESVLSGYPQWTTEGHAFFYYLRGRTKLDKEFTTGGIENDWSTERFGLAGVTQPAVREEDKIEKRWLKTPKVVVAHEFGHLFMLQHSPPRVLDSKEATGMWEEHLAHDVCLMNYDPDTISLCGWCILRKRGWKVVDVINEGLYKGNEKNWVQECKKQLEADVSKGPANKIRLAMFLLDIRNYDSTAGDQNKAARALMKEAANEIPVDKNDQRYIFLLRCQVVFYNKIKELELAQQTLDKLKVCTEFDIDVSDLRNPSGKVEINPSVASNWRLKTGK